MVVLITYLNWFYFSYSLVYVMAEEVLQQQLQDLQLKLKMLEKENEELKQSRQSRSSRSTTSGRKRSAPVGWEVVIHALPAITDKETVLSKLEAMKSPEEFIKLNSDIKRDFVRLVGLMGWEDALTDQIKKVCVLYVSVVICA